MGSGRIVLVASALVVASMSSSCSSPSPRRPESSAPSTSSSSFSSSNPPCVRRDLDARYVGGGAGGQNFLGGIVIRNTGARPCLLTGAVTFAAYWANGARDTKAAPIGVPPPLSVTLPAAMPTYRDLRSDSNLYVFAQLAAPQFTATGTCSAPRGPSDFELDIGPLTFRVANHDLHAAQNKILRGCDGRILLDHIDEPHA